MRQRDDSVTFAEEVCQLDNTIVAPYKLHQTSLQ